MWRLSLLCFSCLSWAGPATVATINRIYGVRHCAAPFTFRFHQNDAAFGNLVPFTKSRPIYKENVTLE
jgi:hypothetical protein